jgi:hypothetical protein
MSSLRRSGTSPLPDASIEWVFFTDRDLGKSTSNALRAAGYDVRGHDDVFPDTRTRDEIWLPQVAAKGWIALTHNKKIRRVAIERDAHMRAGGALFMLIGAPHDQVVRNLVATMPTIVRFRELHEPPFIAHVTRPEAKFPVGTHPGNVRMFLSKADWLSRLSDGV